MANREGQFGSVQCVEVKLVHALALQLAHLLDRNTGSNHLARFLVIVQSANRSRNHAGTLAPQRSAKRCSCGKRVIGKMPGTDGRSMPAAAPRSRKRRIAVRIEKELGDGARRAGIQFAFQVIEVERGARRLGMSFGVGGHGDFKIRNLAQSGHQVQA